MAGIRHGAIMAALSCAAALQGCNSKANLLAAIDGPYVSPSERAEMARRAAAASPQAAPADAVPAARERQVQAALPAPLPTAPLFAGDTRAAPYASFFDHAMARLNSPAPPAERKSVLLSNPPSLQPDLRPCGNQPPAVLVDLDPGGGLLPLTGDRAALPTLSARLEQLRDAGVSVHWITGHTPEAAGPIRALLRQTGLDPWGMDPLIVSRFPGESKQDRRMGLGETHCLLAIAGDRHADFDELYDHLREPSIAAPLEKLVGEGWFLAPPPID